MTINGLPEGVNNSGPDARVSTTRGRRYAIAGGAAAVLIAGGGSLAWAATNSSAGAQPAAAHAASVQLRVHQTGAASGGTTLPAAPTGAPSGKPGNGQKPTGSTPVRPTAMTPSLDGTVTAVNGTQITIKDFQGFTRTIVTSSSTTYKDSLTSTPSIGTKIHAQGTVDANGTSLDATVIEKALGHPGGGPGGPGMQGSSTGPKPKAVPTGAPKDNGKRPAGAPTMSS